MTVQELIESLQKLDPSNVIVFHSYIETGRGGSWIEVQDVVIDVHEDLEDTIRISISGDEDRDGGYD
jgi:hypothetical protein